MDRPAAADDDFTDASSSSLDDQVVQITEPVRRYVRAHTPQPADADDVVQETLTRVLEHGRGLAPDSALAYALVTARHVLADRARESDRHRRHAHRVIDLRQPQRPDEAVTDQEERRALRDALADVPADQRGLLVAHILNDTPITALALEEGKSEGALAAQLARVRARLRLDYVLALRGTRLPTARCRPILLALSAGDTRRQEALRAGQHLLTCSTCSELAEPLLARRRALAAVLPWIGAGPLVGLIRRLWSHRPVQIATAATTAVAVAGTAVLVWGPTPAATKSAAQSPPTTSSSATTSPSPSAAARRSGELVRADDDRPVRARSGDLRSLAGQTVVGRSMRVVSVPADEGFWVSNTGDDRVWIQLRTTNGESRVDVDAGDKVSFTGLVRTHDNRFAGRVGVRPKEGAALLGREGAHVAVTLARLQVQHR